MQGRADVLLVVGARNSSNSNRLREVGEQSGMEAYLIESAEAIDVAWFSPGSRIGVTAGASAPERLVSEVLERLKQLGVDSVTEMEGEPREHHLLAARDRGIREPAPAGPLV